MEEVELIKEDMPFDDVSWVQFSRYLLSLCASFLLERWNPGPSREGIWARRSVTPAHRQSLIRGGEGQQRLRSVQGGTRSGSPLPRAGCVLFSHQQLRALSGFTPESPRRCEGHRDERHTVSQDE